MCTMILLFSIQTFRYEQLSLQPVSRAATNLQFTIKFISRDIFLILTSLGRIESAPVDATRGYIPTSRGRFCDKPYFWICVSCIIFRYYY